MRVPATESCRGPAVGASDDRGHEGLQQGRARQTWRKEPGRTCHTCKPSSRWPTVDPVRLTRTMFSAAKTPSAPTNSAAPRAAGPAPAPGSDDVVGERPKTMNRYIATSRWPRPRTAAPAGTLGGQSLRWRRHGIHPRWTANGPPSPDAVRQSGGTSHLLIRWAALHRRNMRSRTGNRRSLRSSQRPRAGAPSPPCPRAGSSCSAPPRKSSTSSRPRTSSSSTSSS